MFLDGVPLRLVQAADVLKGEVILTIPDPVGKADPLVVETLEDWQKASFGVLNIAGKKPLRQATLTGVVEIRSAG